MPKSQPLAMTPNQQLAHQASVHLQAGNPGLALQTCEMVLSVDEYHADALHVAGLAHKQMGNLSQAIAMMRKSVAGRRPDPMHVFQLATCLLEMGRTKDAAIWFDRLVAIHPNGDTWSNLGVVLMQLGRHADAVKPLKLAAKAERGRADRWANYGLALLQVEDLPAAEVAFSRALTLEPGNEEAQLNLAVLNTQQGKPLQALESYYDLIERGVRLGSALNNCANLLAKLGRYDEAEPMYRRSLEVRNGVVTTWDNWLFCLLHARQSTPQSIVAAMHRYSAHFEAPLQELRQAHGNDRDLQRVLKVGIVSADLRGHAIASFFEPLLQRLSPSSNLHLYAYSNYATEDAVSERMRQHFVSWSVVTSMDDETLAAKIREDGIDILVDLSGHTAGNRLLAFARKPAPLQVSWMGSPGSTGLESMDYYFADPYFLPPGLMDEQFTEKIVQLPASVLFQPAQDSPPVNALPALTNGHITFGSFNHLRKVNRTVIALWAQLLRQVPDSKLLMGGMPEEDSDIDVREWFREEGIDVSRVRFFKVCPKAEFLAQFHEIDIHLDTFPYNGGTTSWHAIYMGIPSISLMGAISASRAGISILGQVGLAHFVATDAAAYVAIGIRWANNLTELADLRAGMRRRFAQSAPNQPALVAQWVERAWRTMWAAWCEGREPQSFSVEPTASEILEMQNKNGTVT